jgi:hypothetical protein
MRPLQGVRGRARMETRDASRPSQNRLIPSSVSAFMVFQYSL